MTPLSSAQLLGQCRGDLRTSHAGAPLLCTLGAALTQDNRPGLRGAETHSHGSGGRTLDRVLSTHLLARGGWTVPAPSALSLLLCQRSVDMTYGLSFWTMSILCQTTAAGARKASSWAASALRLGSLPPCSVASPRLPPTTDPPSVPRLQGGSFLLLQVPAGLPSPVCLSVQGDCFLQECPAPG